MPGPPKKPTRLKVIAGTDKRNKQRLPKNEPDPAADEMAPTEQLTQEQLLVWNQIVPDLVALGVARNTDCVALTLLVQLESQRRQVFADLSKTSMLVKGSTGQARLNPLFKASNDLAANVKALLTEFGLTAAARARVNADAAPRTKSKFGDLDD